MYIACSLLLSAVEAVISDESFKVESKIASEVLKVGQEMQKCLKESRNATQAEEFAKSIVCQLQRCIPDSGRFKTVQSRRERMWSNYHQLRCSSKYIAAWKTFLYQRLGTVGHPIFWQCVGDRLFKSLIQDSFTVTSQAAAVELPPAISQQEVNALRYVAGYVPRAVTKMLKRSANPQKDQLWLHVPPGST